MSGRVRKPKGLARRSIPGARRDSETVEKNASRAPARLPLATDPPPDLSDREAQLSTERVLREFGLPKRNEQQARTLAELRTQRAHSDSGPHALRSFYCPITILSSTNDMTGTGTVGDDALVSDDERSKRWELPARLAGERLDTARKQLKLTKKVLAEMTGIQASQIGRLLKGQLKQPAAGMVFDLCAAMNLDPSYVWFGHQRPALGSHPAPASRPIAPPSVPPSNIRKSTRPRG